MTQSEKYLSPRLTTNNLDLYQVRKAIIRNLYEVLPNLSGTMLDVGCGHMPYKSLILSPPNQVETYIGLDIRSDIYGTPDVEWDGKVMPFPSDSFSCAMATEVLEHCPKPEVIFSETFRVLQPGGLFFFTVPFLWPLHDVPHDEYRYTPFALERLLRNAGFGQIKLRALGGWDGSLAQMMGLWVRRRPMKSGVRKILSFLLKPAVAQLLRYDFPNAGFGEGQMITGVAGTAYKSAILS